MSPARQERTTALETDVDTRLSDIWGAAWQTPTLTDDDEVLRIFGAAIRMAYAGGYTDALVEDSAGRRGELHRAHGYQVP